MFTCLLLIRFIQVHSGFAEGAQKMNQSQKYFQSIQCSRKTVQISSFVSVPAQWKPA